MELAIKKNDNGLVIPVKVVPGSSRSRIAGLLGDSLKINLAAPPEKGKANKQIVKFLAETLNHPKSAITIISGSHDPHKQILIADMTAQELLTHLKPFIG